MNPEDDWTIDRLFAGRPGSLTLFNLVNGYIESLGPVEIAVTKTQVSFGVKTRFAWVWLPQFWTTKRPEDSITLTFATDHQVEDPRIAEAVEPRPGRWTHHVVIEKDSDFDEAVKAWLRDAYAFGNIDRRKKRTKGG